MKKIGFFVGCEGYLNHAKALSRSIYENSSLAKSYELYAVTPEHQNIVVDIPGISHIITEVPEDIKSIPFIDKMFAAAKFEEICEEGYIWLDVDSYFLKPANFTKRHEVCVNPVDKKNVGDVYGEERSELWKIVSSYFQLGEISSYVFTSVTKEKIFPYYNVGMVVVNKQRDLFKTVKQAVIELLNNQKVMEIIDTSALHRIFLHQVIFTCCLIKLYGEKIKPLPKGENYPLHLHESNPHPMAVENIISIRYDNYFDKNNIITDWQYIFNPIKEGLKSNWYYCCDVKKRNNKTS